MNDAPEGRWLSLGRACQILGVNETTLRHWANSGRLRTFRTPGGHRRFSRDEIYSLVDRGHGDARPGGSFSEAALGRIRRRMQRRRTRPDQWLAHFDDEGRERMRVLGRRLLSLATDYLTRTRRRAELDEEARHLGLDYGRELASRSVRLPEAVSAFMFFRSSLREALRESQPADAGAAWADVESLEDQVLLGIAEAYEKAQRASLRPAHDAS